MIAREKWLFLWNSNFEPHIFYRMKYRHLFFSFVVSISFFFSSMNAQTNDWRVYLQQLSEEEADERTIENMFQELSMLEENPMNLNNLTFEQLSRFPLLTHEQVVNLSEFLDRNRPIYTVFELRNVPGFDYNTVERILPFFFAGEMEKERPSISRMLKSGRNEIRFRLDKTLDRRAGYGPFTDSILQKFPNRKYRGEDFYTSLKYSFVFRDKIQFALLGEKDPGEPFFKRDYPKGYDHYGFHLILRDVGKLRTFVVGDFRLSFGQGLVLNNDFMLSKPFGASHIIRRTQEPKRHFSTAESGFFRGTAAVFQIRNVNVTAFYSNKRFDANLSKQGDITSFKTDGYHRTLSEMEKKNNSREQVMGININYRKEGVQVGVSTVYHTCNRMYNPALHEYSYYYLRDSSNANIGIDYSYRLNKLIFAGEAAVAKNGSIAAINAIRYAPSNRFSLSLLFRHFPVSYNAMYAKAFAQNSRVQNESGLYAGATFNPLQKLSTTVYIDLFRFPWVKDRVDKPSKGLDAYFSGIYAMNPDSRFELRYKMKLKEQNARYPDHTSTTVLPCNTQRIRFAYNKALKSGWSFRSVVDAALYSRKYFSLEKGAMFSQNVGYTKGGKLSSNFFVGYFKSDSYATRLYSYERNIQSTFYMPSFYGEGMRFSLSGQCKLADGWSVSVKIGHSRYFDRQTIGTGSNQIDGNSRTDVFTYLRWVF